MLIDFNEPRELYWIGMEIRGLFNVWRYRDNVFYLAADGLVSFFFFFFFFGLKGSRKFVLR